MNSITYSCNQSKSLDIILHLEKCNKLFSPNLDTYVDIPAYSNKIYEFAERFEAWNEGFLIGLVAIYLNDYQTFKGYITNVSVVQEFQRHKIAYRLLTESLIFAKQKGFNSIDLEVSVKNKSAILLYGKLGFAHSYPTSKIGFIKFNLRQ